MPTSPQTASQGPTAAGPAGTGGLVVRSLNSASDFQQCVALQRATWGSDYGDVVPASLLRVSRKVGGVVIGAFSGADMVGFVYGLSGVQEGRLIHWSHMLGVLPRWRNRGLGTRLKRAQREELRALGVEEIQWTFDPLVARNAHLNLCRLGVRVLEYVTEMYGPTGSSLHSFGTDRMVVGWNLTGDRSAEDLPSGPGGEEEEGIAWALPAASDDDTPPPPPPVLPAENRVAIPVPRDVEGLAIRHPEAALAWRLATRGAFQGLLSRGYRVTGFRRATPVTLPHFLLDFPTTPDPS